MKIQHFVSAAIIAAMVSVAPVPVQAEPSTTEQVKNWTLRQWRAAVAEFSKDKAKWASCRKQGKDMKLKGKASWSFLYGCMKA
jgi:hypothetical protein